MPYGSEQRQLLDWLKELQSFETPEERRWEIENAAAFFNTSVARICVYVLRIKPGS